MSTPTSSRQEWRHFSRTAFRKMKIDGRGGAGVSEGLQVTTVPVKPRECDELEFFAQTGTQ